MTARSRKDELLIADLRAQIVVLKAQISSVKRLAKKLKKENKELKEPKVLK